MAEVVNNGNDSPAVKPGEAAGSNSTAGFQSFAEFEAQMAREEATGGGAATVENDGGVRPASQIADQQRAAAEAEEKAAREAAGASDEDEDEDEGEEGAEAGAADGTPEEKAAAEAAAAKGPAKPSLKKRLGELVREKHETATREAAAIARAEAAEERARLAEEAAARGEKPTARKAPDTKQAAPVTDNRPNPEDFEFGEYDPKYQDAIVAWRVEDALNKREAKTAEVTAAEARRTEEAARTERWGGTIEKGAAKNADFEAKVLSGKGWKLSKQMWEMAVDSDVGHDVLYHLASDPAESSRIFDLPLTRQAAEFGKLEARFAQPLDDKSKSAAKDGAAGQMPKAPAPQTRVRGAGGQYKTDAGTKDFAAFEAMMKAEEAARAKARE